MSDLRAIRERDLFLRLLELGHEQDLETVLAEALNLVVRAIDARRGYLEIYADKAEVGIGTVSFACSEEDLAQIQKVISRGIVAESLANNETIHTPAALLDARFADLPSVRTHEIGAVLCTPISSGTPTGALYLEGRSNAGPFSDDDVRLVELVARHVAPQVSRLIGLEKTRRTTDPTLTWRNKISVAGIIGKSNALAEVLKLVALVAPLDVAVFITGPSGTGKTRIARAIHENSPRASGPFVEINSAAIPESLVESELFGAVAGAHSAAARDSDGKVAAANGGTLFLDEIAELNQGSQAKILQLLQSKIYFPLGASTPKVADVRIIAATNASVPDLLERRVLREDLYYRLNVLPIRMPSLAERVDDIAPLADYFVEHACRTHALPRLKFTPATRSTLTFSDWPGNLRQLAHVIEAGAIRAAGEGCVAIEPRHLMQLPESDSGDDALLSFQEATRRFQRSFIEKTLISCDWSVIEAARRLDVTRSHMYNLIRLHGLTRENPADDGSDS